MASCSSSASTSSDDRKDEDSYENGICNGIFSLACLNSSTHCIGSEQNHDELQNTLKSLSLPQVSNGVVPFLRLSNFSNVPPTIRFYTKGCKVKKPPQKLCARLTWCQNTLLPIVMRHSLAVSHFKIVDESAIWIGYWGKHLKSSHYRKIKPFQKVNHYPGGFHLGRKDRLWQHLQEMGKIQTKTSFSIMPHTYILPKDVSKVRAHLSAIGRHVILKPPASARGTGISIVSHFQNVPSQTPLIAQHYVENPMLINGAKFDLRLYVYVANLDPLRIYLYDEGLVRFASVPYSYGDISNQYMHLTNFSINKLAMNDGVSDKPVPKWRLTDFWKFLCEQGIDADILHKNIQDVAVKAVIACESFIRAHQSKFSEFSFTSHELFGMDILVDENLRPWLLEMNISPSLHSGTPLDVSVKANLAKDVLNICGIPYLPNVDSFNSTYYRIKNDPRHKTDTHKQKEMNYLKYYSEHHNIETSIVENLTDADLRILVEFEDELDRKGGFQLLFPLGEETEHYLECIRAQIYSNLLLTEWQKKQKNNRQRGIEILKKFCYEECHIAKRAYTESSGEDSN